MRQPGDSDDTVLALLTGLVKIKDNRYRKLENPFGKRFHYIFTPLEDAIEAVVRNWPYGIDCLKNFLPYYDPFESTFTRDLFKAVPKFDEYNTKAMESLLGTPAVDKKLFIREKLLVSVQTSRQALTKLFLRHHGVQGILLRLGLIRAISKTLKRTIQ